MLIAETMKDLTPDTRVLYVRVKQVYGRETIYPACDDSKIFADLMGKKTLSRADMVQIKALGYSFAHAQPEAL